MAPIVEVAPQQEEATEEAKQVPATPKPTIGIIYPPPELRNIVDKTASFVARNGPEFEARIRQNEINNSKFNFLNATDPYHAYYEHKVKEAKEGKGPAEAIQPPKPTPEKQEIRKIIEPPIIPKEPPAEFEFIAEPPSISAIDLDIVKLTAQFVARNGRQFLTNLMNREQRNYQFDFLRPQHSLFNYFMRLLEQYTKVLIPNKSMLMKLKMEADDPKVVLNQVKYRVEWTRFQEAQKRREEEEAERERVQYAQIDWHDFVVVETVDYQPNEPGLFPPPTCPEEVGSRVLAQQRMEEEGEEVEMEVESDEEGVEEVSKNEESPSPPKEAPPLPPNPEQVVVRKDYNPKGTKTQKASSEQYLISPITGEKIPADKMQEHMRIGLLDPRWVEQRDRAMQERMQQDEVFAPGTAIESSLKQFAERRTDIFGFGDEETAIGKKIGEEERRLPEKVTWDGHTGSMEAATKAARANITIEEQIQQIHKIKGLLPDEEKERIGPAKPAGPPPLPPNPPPQEKKKPPLPPMPPKPLPPPPRPVVITAAPRPQIINPAPTLLMPPHIPGLISVTTAIPASVQHTSFVTIPEAEEEPPSKRHKSEDALVPEADFLKQYRGPVTIKVQVPEASDKAEWKLKGQTVTLTLPLTDTISVLKAKLHEELGMPPGKQKLQYEGMFVKDSNSLAFYNVTPNAVVSLQVKERGGRKK
ncbi:splicing factor 3A subunit 1-like [Ornithodoros turicata]|uniref:splicing factor 3A subunit 1-like n=1 Tax=Ornithodoros turicata TaxID=34597 RepID=UPI0031391854